MYTYEIVFADGAKFIFECELTMRELIQVLNESRGMQGKMGSVYNSKMFMTILQYDPEDRKNKYKPHTSQHLNDVLV